MKTVLNRENYNNINFYNWYNMDERTDFNFTQYILLTIELIFLNICIAIY